MRNFAGVQLLNNKVVILLMVELDNMKQELLAYETPLAEVRDSL